MTEIIIILIVRPSFVLYGNCVYIKLDSVRQELFALKHLIRGAQNAPNDQTEPIVDTCRICGNPSL